MFLRDYLRALVPLFVAFTAYHALVVPMLEPAAVKHIERWPTQPIPQGEDWWAEYFQEGEWQRDKKNPPRVVKTETAVLLFQTREQKNETRWLVKPLTILLPQRSDGATKRAILIKNMEGAEIQFKTAVDWTKELPPVVSGQLLGDITILTPPDDAAKNNGMLISARDIRINKREIWTNQKIKMQLGNSIVEGRQLFVYLDKDLLSPKQPGSKNESPFNGLDRLELTYVDNVHIGLDPGGLLPRKDIPDIAQRQAHATVTCEGAFEFQFHQSQATLKRKVQMKHMVQGLPVDTFDCDQLQLTVGWQGKQSIALATPANNAGANWSVERLEALGSAGRDNRDHSGWLKLIAPGMLSEAHGQHLVMDMLNGIVTLSNRLPGANYRELTNVYLKRESVQVWSPEVQYQTAAALSNSFDDAGKSKFDQNKNRLGALLAQGAGRAQMGNKGDTWTLSWGERLIVRPDPNDSEKDLVDIKGSANVYNDAQGRFTAEQLFLWLNPMTPTLAAQLAPLYPDGNLPQAVPDRMEADGKVDVNSPTLRASVEKMQVWFGYKPSDRQPVAPRTASNTVAPSHSISAIPVGNIADAASLYISGRQPGDQTPNASVNPGGQPLTLLPPTGVPTPPLRQPISPPKSNGRKDVLSTKPTSPLVVTASKMLAKVTRMGEETRIDDLILDGNLTLTKSQLTDDTPWPFTVTGDRLELKQVQHDASDITIAGRPAEVILGSGKVVAPELILKQSDNQLSINHPGTLLIPIEALQKNMSTVEGSASLVSLPGSFPGSSPGSNNVSPAWNAFSQPRTPAKSSDGNIRWREAPQVSWGDRMTFNGKTARFGGGVTINTRFETNSQTLWHVNASSRQLSLEMEQSLSFRTSDSSTTSTSSSSQVSIIRLEDDVNVRAVQTDLALNRRSMEQLKLPRMDIMVPSQTWLGHGPGEIWSRRLGNENPIAGIQPSNDPSRPSLTDRFAENNKQCIHLSFLGRMEGNMAQRRTSFYDIQALMGPIASWEDALDVHTVDRLGRNQSHLIADQLNIFDASGLSWNQQPNGNRSASSNAAWELEAVSRVRMQSLTDSGEFAVLSNSLRYAAISDTVRIEGSTREPARLTRAQPNANPIDFQVKSAAYRLKTGELDMQITKFAGTIPENLQPGFNPNAPAKNPSGIQVPASAPSDNSSLPSPRDTRFQPSGRR